ncbi:hypothetical protein HOT42_gp48 [Microbacterium phage Metamorphoo]|uniref:Uncharacterized protein n=1 Tax=Microbacterium phage Metamorphoo TaxID=2201437 RepID=A0A2Z4Q6K5_9CAUD|nr:hypothetical protein HOT42_gp48 [Microbacterium phage Metamorphoo]AWY05399.1 hypothetical protein SEA_METAMORPHOO_48 [Microbacterium phage Metamorphoo]
MHTNTEPLPADLAHPRRDRPKGSDLAGIIVGAVTGTLAIGLTIVALVVL